MEGGRKSSKKGIYENAEIKKQRAKNLADAKYYQDEKEIEQRKKRTEDSYADDEFDMEE